MTFITGATMWLSGHESAIALHKHSPEKLASAEALFETTSHAPLSIGGVVDPNTLELNYALEIPNMLSLLVGLDPNTVVKGLKEFPQETWPPFYTHTLFNLMVGTAAFTLQLQQLPSYIGTLFTEKGTELPKWLLWGAAACGPVMMLGIEFGWIFSCSGRQPWTIYGMQRTVDASTRADFVGPLFILFIILYIGLGILTVLYYGHSLRNIRLQMIYITKEAILVHEESIAIIILWALIFVYSILGSIDFGAGFGAWYTQNIQR